MMSLLINKKAAILFTLVLQFIFTNYANAAIDASFESIEIEDVHSNFAYNRGDSFNVSCNIKNVGNSTIPSHTIIIRVYAGNSEIGHSYVDSISIGSTRRVRFSCKITDYVPYGPCTIRGSLFLDNYSENNTALWSPDILISSPPPSASYLDLWVPNVNVISPYSSNIFNSGGEIKFGCIISNAGNETSDSFNVNFSIGSYDIGYISCDPLEPNGVQYINETDAFSIPSNIPDGIYVINAEVVSSKDDITSNNQQTSNDAIKVAAPYTDLLVSNILFTGNKFGQGDSVNIITSIVNIGTYKAENIYAECYIGDYLAGNAYHYDLGPELSDNIMIQSQIPENLPDGYYNMRVVVSCSDDVDTNNNIMISDTTIWVGEYADLEVKSLQATGGTYQPKDMIEIYSLIENIGDGISNPYTIDYYMSKDKNITAMDYKIGRIKRSGLEPGAQHSYNTTFKLPPNLPVSNYYVGVKVTSSEEDNLGNNSGCDNKTIGITHPANYVCGHVSYEYKIENDQDIRYALLKIIDYGTDRIIAQTYTDENGNYGEVVTYDASSTPNIYIKVYAESVSGAYPGTQSKMCIIKDGVNQGWFSQKSSAFPHPQNSSCIIDYKTGSRGFMVFDSMVEGFIQAREFFGIEMEEITVYWPSTDNATYYYPGEGIFVGIDDEWDRDVIMHEYGHYIAELYDFCQGDVGENPIHTWDDDLRAFPVERTEEHAANLAFRESWPTLFSIATQFTNSDYPRSGDTRYHDYYSYYEWSYELDLEQDTFDKGSPGEFYDNMNCCAMWDIFDNHPDSANFNEEVTDPNLAKTWRVLRGYKPEDMNDFWVAWFHSNSQDDNLQAVTGILDEHEMSFAASGKSPSVPKNHAPVAVAGEDKTVAQNITEGAQVHLDASGSHDSDGDSLSYIWRYGAIQYTGVQADIILPVGETELELEVSDGKITSWDTIKVTVTPMN